MFYSNHDVSEDDALFNIESPTTVPRIMNGLSVMFIKQELERRKERDLHQEKEREKIGRLERTSAGEESKC